MIISYLLAIFGLLISLVGLPGIWVVLLAIIISAFSVGFEILPLWVLFLYFTFTLLASLLDNVAVVIGAKQGGAGKWGMIGAVLGGIIGLFVGSFVGVLFGPFFGAVLLEIVMEKKDTDAAIKAGIGTFVGYIFSILLKFIAAVIMVSTWLYIINK